MKNKKAFTLVELIVTITILAILWTIGFLSFQSYTVYSRDVVRLSHISNMKSVLEYNYTETWRYPKPDWENNITYSWAIAWIQWDFWKDTKRKTKRLDSIPLDPLTQNTYSYSVTKNQSEFELGSIFEWDEVAMVSPHLASPKGRGIIWESYADNSDFKAYISWNYNWQILKVKSWSIDYILAVPSIILSDYTDLRLEDIIDNANSKFVLNWYNNIPSNYWMTNSGSWELDFLKKENFVLFEWDLDTLSESWSLQEELWTKLALAYSWTTIENNSWIKEIVNAHSWNKLYLTQNIIKSTLIPKFEITAVSVTNWCASQPNYTNANFVSWTATSENQVWQNSDSNDACYYSCENSYTWSDCWTAPVYASCKDILDGWLSIWDWVYTIDPENNWVWFDVYCDMTTDWGGWTNILWASTQFSNTSNFWNWTLNSNQNFTIYWNIFNTNNSEKLLKILNFKDIMINRISSDKVIFSSNINSTFVYKKNELSSWALKSTDISNVSSLNWNVSDRDWYTYANLLLSTNPYFWPSYWDYRRIWIWISSWSRTGLWTHRSWYNLSTVQNTSTQYHSIWLVWHRYVYGITDDTGWLFFR